MRNLAARTAVLALCELCRWQEEAESLATTIGPWRR